MIEINFNKYFNLVFISIGGKHFEFALFTISEKEHWNYSAVFSVAITNDIFCFQFFGKEIVVWSSEGGLFDRKYKNNTWLNKGE